MMPKPDSCDESGSSVQPLQQTSSAQRAGLPLTPGIYTQKVIATVRAERRLDI